MAEPPPFEIYNDKIVGQLSVVGTILDEPLDRPAKAHRLLSVYYHWTDAGQRDSFVTALVYRLLHEHALLRRSN